MWLKYCPSSCTTQYLGLQYLDQGKVVGSLFVDISKAFDSLNHRILLGSNRIFLNESKVLLLTVRSRIHVPSN